MSDATMRTIVAIPVKDEAARIGGCMQSLAAQTVRPAAVVLVINNTTDATASIVRALMPALPITVQPIEHVFAPEAASAGAARRMAMEAAAGQLGSAGLLLTTDADGRVPADWVAANQYHVRHGAEAVAGRAVLEPAEAALIPPALHEDDALECAYARTLAEIEAMVDPVPWDPWPRHSEHSGASIAVTLAAYRRAGGMPAAAIAEDRRFFAALGRVDARIRHAPEIAVVVSGRIVGRAPGGMADTIRRRLGRADPYLDDALEPAADFIRRVALRARFRRAWGAGRADGLAAALGVSAALVEAALAVRFMGEGWAMLEAASPVLTRRRVPARDVERQQAAAARLLEAAWVD